MGWSRVLFKITRDTKGIFHPEMCTIKDRNGMDLTEAADIKEKWQEYREKPYQKKKEEDLNDPDNHDGVIVYLVRHPGM